MDNAITQRADFLYSIIWKAKTEVNGWKKKPDYIFEQDSIHHIPYGRPIDFGKYIGYDVSISDFLIATNDASSDFYKKYSGKIKRIIVKSKENVNGKQSEIIQLEKTSTYYAMDCSTFVSLCWGLPKRQTTQSWSSLAEQNLAQNMGRCVAGSFSKLKPGDALNNSEGKHPHIVLVSRKSKNYIEITEMTPPELTRTHYTREEFEKSKFCTGDTGEYIIYRYNNLRQVKPFTIR